MTTVDDSRLASALVVAFCRFHILSSYFDWLPSVINTSSIFLDFFILIG